MGSSYPGQMQSAMRSHWGQRLQRTHGLSPHCALLSAINLNNGKALAGLEFHFQLPLS